MEKAFFHRRIRLTGTTNTCDEKSGGMNGGHQATSGIWREANDRRYQAAKAGLPGMDRAMSPPKLYPMRSSTWKGAADDATGRWSVAYQAVNDLTEMERPAQQSDGPGNLAYPASLIYPKPT